MRETHIRYTPSKALMHTAKHSSKESTLNGKKKVPKKMMRLHQQQDDMPPGEEWIGGEGNMGGSDFNDSDNDWVEQ